MHQDLTRMNTVNIEAFRKGDALTFEAVFWLYYRPLCYFGVQLLKNEAEVEDVVKDSFVKLWHKHTDFNHLAAIKSFLYITTRNACLNVLRNAQVKETVHQELAYLSEQKVDEPMLNQLIKLELMQEIYNEIENIPEKRRAVFKMAYLEGMRNEEIATLLNISIFTVKKHKAKALIYLRTRFSDHQLLLLLSLCASAVSWEG